MKEIKRKTLKEEFANLYSSILSIGSRVEKLESHVAEMVNDRNSFDVYRENENLQKKVAELQFESNKMEGYLEERNEQIDELTALVEVQKDRLSKSLDENKKLCARIEELEADNVDLLTKVDPEKDAAMDTRFKSLIAMTNCKKQVIDKQANELAAKDIEIKNLKAKIAELEGENQNAEQ